MMPSGAANMTMFDSQIGIDRAGPRELDDEHEADEDQERAPGSCDGAAATKRRPTPDEDSRRCASAVCRYQRVRHRALAGRRSSRSPQSGPLDDLAEIGVDIQEDEIRGDQGQHERREHRPDEPAAAAGQAYAADHDGGQAAQRVVDAGERGADAGRHRQAEAADGAEQA